MSYETLRVEVRDGVLEVVLDRPDALNPLDEASAEELRDVFAGAPFQEGVRAVLLRGEGRVFCAGGNVKRMAESAGKDPTEFFDGPLGKIHDAARSLATLPLPVVGAVHGVAAGAGFNLALCCDLLLAAEGTRFNQAFVKLGLVPDTGGTFTLPRLVGTRKAMELFLLGDFVDADEALRLGILNRVVSQDRLVDEARELVARLAAGPTAAYAEIKQLLRDTATASFAEALELERQAQLRVGTTADFVEGVRAFLEKRPAGFRGR
jgi:2-(1,2-epoxy-1,2-dihydrophenyl)acetyl-CoA isomerase